MKPTRVFRTRAQVILVCEVLPSRLRAPPSLPIPLPLQFPEAERNGLATKRQLFLRSTDSTIDRQRAPFPAAAHRQIVGLGLSPGSAERHAPRRRTHPAQSGAAAAECRAGGRSVFAAL